MTEAERQQVIDALELWGTDDVSQEDYEKAKQALAIMRREREPLRAEKVYKGQRDE